MALSRTPHTGLSCAGSPADAAHGADRLALRHRAAVQPDRPRDRRAPPAARHMSQPQDVLRWHAFADHALAARGAEFGVARVPNIGFAKHGFDLAVTFARR